MRSPPSPTGRAYCGSGEACRERVELRAELGGAPVAELGEVRADAGELGAPRVRVDGQRGGDVVGRGVEALEHEVLGAGHHADRGVGAGGVAVEATADPLEHARILAEAGPQEVAV